MSRFAPGPSTLTSGPTILPPTQSESKRDRKRRETLNKIELLHDESWRTRDEKFSQLYKDYHNETKGVNKQPPTAPQYLLKLYPVSLERDALMESTEIEFQYKSNQAMKGYENERESIEAQYWEARDQVRSRLLGAIEERRRKLREEKEGGDVISEALIEASVKPRPTRRMPFKNRIPQPNTSHPQSHTSSIHTPPSDPSPSITPSNIPTTIPKNDILLHSLLAPALAQISTDDILTPNSTSLVVLPPINSTSFNPVPKRGPRGKEIGGGGLGGKENGDIVPAPGTATALAIASGQQAPVRNGRNAGGANQGGWVIGKSLAELRRMESASQLEIESDWARIQGTGGRGRRNRGD